MSPADALGVFGIGVLRFADVEIRAGYEFDELSIEAPAEIAAAFRALAEMLERVAVRLVVGRIDEALAAVLDAVTERHSRMVQVERIDRRIANLEWRPLELMHVQRRHEVPECDRKIIRVHLAAQHLLEREPLSSRTV